MITFNFNGNPVRILHTDDEAFVAAMDVAENLGYSEPQKAIARICKNPQSMEGMQMIASDDAYRLILCAPRKATGNFEAWLVEKL